MSDAASNSYDSYDELVVDKELAEALERHGTRSYPVGTHLRLLPVPRARTAEAQAALDAFIGCIKDGPHDLSERYKEILREELGRSKS